MAQPIKKRKVGALHLTIAQRWRIVHTETADGPQTAGETEEPERPPQRPEAGTSKGPSETGESPVRQQCPLQGSQIETERREPLHGPPVKPALMRSTRTLTMKHFVIFDRNAGLLQFSGEFASAEAAIEAFDADVGIDPHGQGLDAIAALYDTREVTAEQRAAVEDWCAHGSKADQFPL
jgi:hypothetical protein